MSALRLTGFLVGILIIAFAIVQYRRRHYRKGELLLGLAIGAGLAVVSLRPSVADWITALFQAPTRIVALAIVGNLLLFGIVLIVLRDLAQLRGSLGELVRALAREGYQGRRKAEQEGDIVIIIPAFNEEKNLDFVLPEIPAVLSHKQVSALVILDGTRDQSAAVATKYQVPVTSHAINRGGGAALRTGFELALQAGAEIVVTMDADGQHNPSEIVRLVEPILADEVDVVLGNRFAGSYDERGSARHFGIVIFSWLVSFLSGTRIHDCTNGFRAIRSSSLVRLDLREQQFHSAEFIMEAARNKLRIREVPVSVMKRHEGQSKKPPGLRYPLGYAWALLRIWLRS